ncbi:unnamed protein product [Arabidopsis thaliana]|uniref:Defensin-like protein 103 n=2 Tax=Arabidopsis thaliana TaxID=3702 RepID=DF103_ARATH|nr:Molecular chaperone Hsp40/DnaJ family protein [Arabidopsis thaliana]Q8GXR4.1 RecName: Full=Defensin-like protein 103; Flags: Precursor [Arabidopsis thaliana]AAP04106.1 unknown protein [Arabidopsis thaliana]AEC07012.1 Molecular chaperone Hsp40/DnaJ family protein [Arabidopsis thaliana]CAA0367402.1 unnamed protein product [Arabidopsis thaliana]VYS52944.1 unnamed protein product [Arabidopsis thaliana]BAC42715.1 unknown protein [Arabidopsis thaliana]|eukprot:NP_850000.1 Molecular chaperone Hsp40/DnaJ family protein [Arabidopsis thaliana]
MAITRKNLVAFCFTILFIISSIHCLPTTARSPGYEIGPQRRRRVTCFSFSFCKPARGLASCDLFCKRLKFESGLCTGDLEKCCCIDYIN